MPRRGNENWRQQAQQMRKESRAVEPPTYQLGYGQMPELPGHYPHNPNNQAQLQQKLAYQQALKARQAWLNTGNRPGQNYPDLPQQGSRDPNTVPAPGQPYTPPATSPTVGLPQPQIPFRGGNKNRVRNRNRGYPSLTY
jgi:hypothetical protein